MPVPRTPPHQRFWPKVDTSAGLFGCWPWLANVTHDGYGLFALGRDSEGRGHNIRPHRFAYQQVRGPIPDGLELDHLCKNTLCCNPAHLEPVTGAENKRRGDSFSGVNARKTHCLRGHPLAGANVRINPRGSRVCVACAREATRSHARKARAA